MLNVDNFHQVNFPGGEGSYNNQEIPPQGDNTTGPFLVQVSSCQFDLLINRM